MRVLIRSGKDPWTVVSPQRTLERNVIANNVGNLVFTSAVHRALSAPGVSVSSNRWNVSPDNADRINDEYDVFVVPLANAFRNGFRERLQQTTELIERLTIPVVVVGVGAQSDLEYDADRISHLDESVKRFVSAVLDRSSSIGVRGEFTAEYLQRLGFRDVDVIGCPSMFLRGPELRVEPTVDALDAESPIAITISPYVKMMGSITMANYQRYPNMVYVGQDVDTLDLMLRGQLAEDAEAVSPIPVNVSHPLYQQGRMRFFVDPWTWFDFLAQQRFAFGTRIHGTIAALLAGTPAVLLAHDSRTLELARYHDIPHRLVSDVPADVDAAQLFAEADFSALHAGHRERFETYRRFLEKNGLPHVFTDETAAGGQAYDEKVRSVRFPGPVLPRTDPVRSPDEPELGAEQGPVRRLVSAGRRRIRRLAGGGDAR